MRRITDCEGDRDLDFLGLLGEVQALIGERVTIEAAGGGRPIALEVRGTLVHLSDMQLTFGRSVEGPAVLVLGVEESDARLWLREAEITSARAFDIETTEGVRPARHIQIALRGEVELIVGVDALAECLEG
jgi:hypothetical protein